MTFYAEALPLSLDPRAALRTSIYPATISLRLLCDCGAEASVDVRDADGIEHYACPTCAADDCR